MSYIYWCRRCPQLVRVPMSYFHNSGLKQPRRKFNFASASNVIMKTEVSKFLIALLRSDSVDEQVMAAQTLSNFSYDPTWRSVIIRSGAVSPLLKLVSHPSGTLRGDCAICLSHLSWYFSPELVGMGIKYNNLQWNSSVPNSESLSDVFFISDLLCPVIIDAILGVLKDPFASRKVTSTLLHSNKRYHENENNVDNDLLKQLPRHEYINDKHRLAAALNSFVSIVRKSPSQCEYILSCGAIPTLVSLVEHKGQHNDDVMIRNGALSAISSLVQVPGMLVYVDHSHIFWMVAAISKLLKPAEAFSNPACSDAEAASSAGYIYQAPPDSDGFVYQVTKATESDDKCFSHSQMLAVHVLQGMCRFAEARPLIVHAGALVDIVGMFDSMVGVTTSLSVALHDTHNNQLPRPHTDLITILQLLYSLAQCSSFCRVLLSVKAGERYDIVRGALFNGSLAAKECISGEVLYVFDSIDSHVEEVGADANIVKNTDDSRSSVVEPQEGGRIEGASDGSGVLGGGEVAMTTLLDSETPAKQVSREDVKARLVYKLYDEQWLAPLAAALNDGSEVCVQYTTGVLSHFADSGKEMQKKIVEAGMLPRILELLSDPGNARGYGSCAESIQTHTARLVCSLTQNSSLHADICDRGGVEVLSSVMQNEYLCGDARKFSALGLANLANGPKAEGKGVISDATLLCLEAYLDEDVYKWM
jgi:hypothetical protein